MGSIAAWNALAKPSTFGYKMERDVSDVECLPSIAAGVLCDSNTTSIEGKAYVTALCPRTVCQLR